MLLSKKQKELGLDIDAFLLYLLRKYGLKISQNTIKTVLKQNAVSKNTRRTKKDERNLYDYESLIPFTEFQLDAKHLLDKESLPMEVYEHIKKYNLPLYEWNIIDVATRTRFTADFYELSSTFGFMFILFVALWLRTHNVRNQIKIRLDNGEEFCGGSQRKLKEWNTMFIISWSRTKSYSTKSKALDGYN